MRVLQSASLVAGVCTLCVAASTSVSPVLAQAAATPGPQERPYELAAASDILVDGINVAGLPLRNFVTILNAVAGAAGGGNGTGGGGATSLQALPNLLYSQLVAGTLTQASATAAINAALATEQLALGKLAETPGEIIATDIAVISQFLANFGFGSLGGALGAPATDATVVKTAAIESAAAETGPTPVNIANALGIPLHNFVAILNAVAGAAGGGNGTGGGGATSFQALPNLLYSQLAAGTLTEESATKAINAALATEQTALDNLAATPGNIIEHDVAVLSALLGGSTPSLQTAKVSAAAPELTSGPAAVDVANVVSLPLQNSITALNAVAGAAGGGNGTGGGGATSFQALPNVLYGQLAAGTLTQASATTAINAAVSTEQTALTNLAATPGKIIATDVAAIQKLAPGFGSGALATNKVVSTADSKDTTNTTSVSTGPGRHAAKTGNGNPVSSAIKAIKDASNGGSYVGKHRADTGGERKSPEGAEG